MIHMTETKPYSTTDPEDAGAIRFKVECRCPWESDGHETRSKAREAGDAHLAVANAPQADRTPLHIAHVSGTTPRKAG